MAGEELSQFDALQEMVRLSEQRKIARSDEQTAFQQEEEARTLAEAARRKREEARLRDEDLGRQVGELATKYGLEHFVEPMLELSMAEDANKESAAAKQPQSTSIPERTLPPEAKAAQAPPVDEAPVKRRRGRRPKAEKLALYEQLNHRLVILDANKLERQNRRARRQFREDELVTIRGTKQGGITVNGEVLTATKERRALLNSLLNDSTPRLAKQLKDSMPPEAAEVRELLEKMDISTAVSSMNKHFSKPLILAERGAKVRTYRAAPYVVWEIDGVDPAEPQSQTQKGQEAPPEPTVAPEEAAARDTGAAAVAASEPLAEVVEPKTLPATALGSTNEVALGNTDDFEALASLASQFPLPPSPKEEVVEPVDPAEEGAGVEIAVEEIDALAEQIAEAEDVEQADPLLTTPGIDDAITVTSVPSPTRGYGAQPKWVTLVSADARPTRQAPEKLTAEKAVIFHINRERLEQFNRRAKNESGTLLINCELDEYTPCIRVNGDTVIDISNQGEAGLAARILNTRDRIEAKLRQDKEIFAQYAHILRDFLEAGILIKLPGGKGTGKIEDEVFMVAKRVVVNFAKPPQQTATKEVVQQEGEVRPQLTFNDLSSMRRYMVAITNLEALNAATRQQAASSETALHELTFKKGGDVIRVGEIERPVGASRQELFNYLVKNFGRSLTLDELRRSGYSMGTLEEAQSPMEPGSMKERRLKERLDKEVRDLNKMFRLPGDTRDFIEINWADYSNIHLRTDLIFVEGRD